MTYLRTWNYIIYFLFNKEYYLVIPITIDDAYTYQCSYQVLTGNYN